MEREKHDEGHADEDEERGDEAVRQVASHAGPREYRSREQRVRKARTALLQELRELRAHVALRLLERLPIAADRRALREARLDLRPRRERSEDARHAEDARRAVVDDRQAEYAPPQGLSKPWYAPDTP
jgi:hypothetical protein